MFLEKIIELITNKLFYKPILYIFIGIIFYSIVKRIIISLFNRQSKLLKQNKNRYKTLVQLLIDIIKFVVIFIVIISILSVYGVNVQAALAGLGIVSVVIGLAFQDLFKDYIVGFSIILEDYFSVGDTITVADFRGEVIHIGLKSTKIKSYDGSIMAIANRNIDKVINYSRSQSLAVVEIPVAYESDLDKVEKVLSDLFKTLPNFIPEIEGDITIWGVEELGDSAVVYKIVAPTVPMQHFMVQRKIRKAVKNRFDKEKIKIPYTQIEVHNGK